MLLFHLRKKIDITVCTSIISVQLNSSFSSCVWEHTAVSVSGQLIFQVQQCWGGDSPAEGSAWMGGAASRQCRASGCFACCLPPGSGGWPRQNLPPERTVNRGRTTRCGPGSLCWPGLVRLIPPALGSVVLSWTRSCSRRELLSLAACALCGHFRHFPRMKRVAKWWRVPFPPPCETKHGLETSASLWTMGITDKVKFTLMFSSLKHSHWHQWHVFCRPGHGWAAHAPWYFEAGWTCPLGCCSHTSLWLCTSAVYVRIAPRVWRCHRAGPSFVCQRSWLQALLYSHRQNVWFRDCSEVFSHSETSVSSCCSALVFTSFSEPKPPA